MNYQVASFLMKHNFVCHVDVLTAAQAILDDMKKGLKKEKSNQDMIRTFCNPPKNPVRNESVIVIDAGGTNFRSCLVSFDDKGEATISEMEKTAMPGVAKELSKKDFFNQIASNLDHLKNKADKIGFCFSYPMEITEDGDGILLGFSKEVKAPEVVGSKVGECLKAALKEKGWNDIKQITLCNDTVSALLAGNACVPSTEVSSYIGMILGTGLNAAYLQPACDICGIKEQIIVCESGKFLGVNQSDFDKQVCAASTSPDSFFLEKLCSGAYLGPVSYYALTAAAKEGVFSEKMSAEILKLDSLTLIEMDKFLHGPYNTETVLGKICAESATDEDFDRIIQILDAICERSARYGAAILTACALQTGKGKQSHKPICILCNGTTFFKTWMIRERVYAYLDEVLTKQSGVFWKIVSIDNDITLGTAIAGLI